MCKLLAKFPMLNLGSHKNQTWFIFLYLFVSGVPETNGHSPAHSSTSQTGRSASGGPSAGTGGASGPSSGGAVVDLTLDDSSDEEEGGGGAGDSEDTEDSQDSPAPKRGRYDYDKDLVTAY